MPFALLFALRQPRRRGRARLTVACLGVLVVLALVFAAIGFVEYATRHLLLNPKVIASNQLEDDFRVNSLFFDPNIYGRFLALVMVLRRRLAAVGAALRTAVAVAAAVLAVLWGGLVLTLSQSSFAALLVGPRGARRAALERAARARASARSRSPLARPSWSSRRAPLRLDLGSAQSADGATSGRYDLVEGGVRAVRASGRSRAGARARSRASTAAPRTSRPSARRRPRTRSR